MTLQVELAQMYRDSLTKNGIEIRSISNMPKVLMYSNIRTPSWVYRVSNLSAMYTLFGGKVLLGVRANASLHDYYEKNSDILFVHRSEYTFELAKLIGAFKSQGKPIIFDTDDLVIHVKNIPGLFSALALSLGEESNLVEWYARISRLQAIAEEADHITSTTDQITEFCDLNFRANCSTVRNFPTPQQFLTSSSLKEKSPVNKVGTIGYFSGTPTHRLDFQIVENSLASLLSSRDIQLILAGYVDSRVQNRFVGDRVSYLEPTEMDELIRNISSVDLNLAPLRQSDFTDSKSALKIFDAALAGTFTFASPTREYVHYSENTDFKFSRIVKDSDWGDSLREAVESGVNAIDTKDSRRSLGLLAVRESQKFISLCQELHNS